MSVESLKNMKSQLVSCVQSQMGDLKNVSTKELGQAIDMIKDLSEAIYYVTITDSMEKSSEDENRSVNNINYYTTPMYKTYPDYYRDMEKEAGHMFYSTGSASSSGSNPKGTSGSGEMRMYDSDFDYVYDRRDPREGRSGIRRRMYMEGKESHNDPTSQLKELEIYLQQLSTDIVEMVKDASQQEKATLRQKMTTLANKIM